MLKPKARPSEALNLKAGEWVEVRTREEILATLDERGCMEIFRYGGDAEVLRAGRQGLRQYRGFEHSPDDGLSVHLNGVRFGGEGHGKCQAGCPKEATAADILAASSRTDTDYRTIIEVIVGGAGLFPRVTCTRFRLD